MDLPVHDLKTQVGKTLYIPTPGLVSACCFLDAYRAEEGYWSGLGTSECRLMRARPPDRATSRSYVALLDVGCGAGAFAVELAKRAGHVDALDRSPAMMSRQPLPRCPYGAMIPLDDAEFRLGRGYRSRPLAQGCIALVVAAALFAAGLHMPALRWLAVFPLAYAAGSFAVCAWRGLVSTRLTARGIEIRRFRRRLVPWQAIRDIQAISYDHVADVPVCQCPHPEWEFQRRGPWEVAAVRIVCTSGHRIQLPAPLVTESQADPDFDDKVQLVKARWQQAVIGTAGHLRYPGSY